MEMSLSEEEISERTVLAASVLVPLSAQEPDPSGGRGRGGSH